MKKPRTLTSSQVLPKPIEEVWAFFADPRNLELVMPKAARFRLVEAPRDIGPGSRIRYRTALLGEVVAEIQEWDPPNGFADLQVKGPYAYWRHRHSLTAVPAGTRVDDAVVYRLRGGLLGTLLDLPHRVFLTGVFAYRRRALAKMVARRRRSQP